MDYSDVLLNISSVLDDISYSLSVLEGYSKILIMGSGCILGAIVISIFWRRFF